MLFKSDDKGWCPTVAFWGIAILGLGLLASPALIQSDAGELIEELSRNPELPIDHPLAGSSDDTWIRWLPFAQVVAERKQRLEQSLQLAGIGILASLLWLAAASRSDWRCRQITTAISRAAGQTISVKPVR